MQFGKWIQTNRRNLLLPSSVQEDKPTRGTRGSYPSQGRSPETASRSDWHYPREGPTGLTAAHPTMLN